MLRAEGLVRVFGEGESRVQAVDGIDLVVRPGEVLLIMGPSGSGKTTLLSLLGGLLRPTAGTVWIGDHEITVMGESELAVLRRHAVGIVFQRFNLLSALSASENVQVAMNLAGVKGAAAREKAGKLLGDLGMAARLDFRPGVLSGGEQQRVSIARALANDPAVILADEPTANLDAKHGQSVVRLLRQIAKDQSRAVVIVSHDERIRDVADRILWLEDGRLRDDERPSPSG